MAVWDYGSVRVTYPVANRIGHCGQTSLVCVLRSIRPENGHCAPTSLSSRNISLLSITYHLSAVNGYQNR